MKLENFNAMLVECGMLEIEKEIAAQELIDEEYVI